jgi:glycosyltransferase involved in cell wall biosynthesis
MGNYRQCKCEVIIVDGGSTDDLKDFCLFMAQHINLKYIYIPIGEFINAAYPRNCGFRIAEGEIITMLDADYWPGEHFIEGCVAPFMDGSRDIINNGYVIDTNKTQLGVQHVESINNYLMSDQGVTSQILSAFEKMKIPGPKPASHIWLWSAPRLHIFEMNGYDEKFIGSYRKEDDSFFYRLMNKGLQRHNQEYKTFNCLHLYHPAAQRTDPNNANNDKYFATMGAKNPTKIIRNEDREWGKLIKYSFSIINGQTLECEQHEKWINDNNDQVASYMASPYWESLEECKAYGYKG